jgi:UDP-N-acetylmuramate dehydrogenase
MLEILNDVPLKPLHTFGTDVRAEAFVKVADREDVEALPDLLKERNYLILGGGSNVLFTDNYRGIVVKPVMNGLNTLDESEGHIVLEAGAGLDWDAFVAFCVKNGYGGVENLSLIPGNVGASPIQNIGAYGVEIEKVIEGVRFFNLAERGWNAYAKGQCGFGYRQSVFKKALKNKCVIVSVVFRLTKKKHDFQLGYGDLSKLVKEKGGESLQAVRDAVIEIRQGKLPDPKVKGNAGSFFKNPVISHVQFIELQKIYPDMPFYDLLGEKKIPAAWLIEKCGWKGKTIGNAGVHHKQALVLVNANGMAKGKEIVELAKQIKNSVQSRFQIELDFEVNIV